MREAIVCANDQASAHIHEDSILSSHICRCKERRDERNLPTSVAIENGA